MARSYLSAFATCGAKHRSAMDTCNEGQGGFHQGAHPQAHAGACTGVLASDAAICLWPFYPPQGCPPPACLPWAQAGSVPWVEALLLAKLQLP